jgi:PAS domain-containing protein
LRPDPESMSFVASQARIPLEDLQDWPQFIDERDRSMMTERWAHSLASGEPFAAEFRLRRADGICRWFHATAVPVRAPDRSIVRW